MIEFTGDSLFANLFVIFCFIVCVYYLFKGRRFMERSKKKFDKNNWYRGWVILLEIFFGIFFLMYYPESSSRLILAIVFFGSMVIAILIAFFIIPKRMSKR